MLPRARTHRIRAIHFSWLLLLWAGVAATLVMTGFAAALWDDAGTGVGPLRMIGAALGAPPLSRRALVVGAVAHVLIGVAIAPAVYGFVFHMIGRADALTGLALGLLNALAAGIGIPLLYARDPYGAKTRPGPFAHRWGATVPLGIVLSHAVYGTLLGYIYI